MDDIERYRRDQETQVFQNIDEKQSLQAAGVTEEFAKIAACVGYTIDDLCELLESGTTTAELSAIVFDKVQPGPLAEITGVRFRAAGRSAAGVGARR